MRYVSLIRRAEEVGPCVNGMRDKGYSFVSMTAVQQSGSGMPIQVVLLFSQDDPKKK